MNEYGFLYIGGTYKNFSQEAKDFSVNRRVPLNSLSTYEWGDIIICGTYQSKATRVLGHFPIDRISLLDQRLYDAVRDHLEMLGLIVSKELFDEYVVRHCGHYTLEEVVQLNLPLHILVKYIRDTGKRLGIVPRVMVGSNRYVECKEEKYLEQSFNRGLMRVRIDQKLKEFTKPTGELALLTDYYQFGHRLEENCGIVTDLREFIG